MLKPDYYEPFIPGEIYHVYNKTVGKELLFKSEMDYFFFLQKIRKYILPIADLYTYCLLPNHFHFLLRIKEKKELSEGSYHHARYWPEKVFTNFFISYSKSFNYAYNRLGRLFLQSFKRIIVEEEEYLQQLVYYIHRNPFHHGYCEDYSQWKHSSFHGYFDSKSSIISKEKVMSYFPSMNDYIAFHEENNAGLTEEKYFLD